MKKLLFKFFCLFALVAANNEAFAQATAFCPSVTATSSASSPLCSGNCAVLNASVVPVNATTSYSVTSIPYTPFAYSGGTPVSVGTDDVWSPVVNLGFNFCYFGNTYSQCILGSNGQLCFNTALASGSDAWSITTAIPSTANMPGNTICAAFRDIDPSYGGTMAYYFSGTAPCRALVIYWSSIPLYSGSCSSLSASTFQLVLYENTNYIDVYIANSTSCSSWNGGRGIIGIQNSNATVAYFPASRNYPTTWTAVNEGWRFVPTGAQSYTVTWAGPSGVIGTGLTQTVCPSATTNYTATMNVTSCSGVNSTYSSAVSVPVSPNPPPVITVNNINQYSCTSSTNSAAITLSSGTPGYTLNWSPAPTSSVSTATTYTATGLTPGTNTISVIDASGCGSSTVITVNPPPPVPTFSLQAPFGTVVGCNPSTITLNAINTSTNTSITNLTYTWTSISTGTQTGASISGQAPSGPNTYTVFASDITAGSCVAIQTITVTQSLTSPVVNVTPLTATITCNGFPKSFTATCTAPTTNIFGNWYDPSGTPMGSPSGSVIPMSTNNCGIYSVTYTNVVNGCTTTKQVTVTCDPTVPTMTVNALDGYVINCLKPCLKFNITASTGPAPKTYSWTNMTTSVTTVPSSGGYTICVPGNYLAEYQDGNSCRISQQITVSIDTLRPSPSATTTLAGGSFTLSCYQPSLTATAITSPMLPPGNYAWTVPPNLTITTPTIAIDQSSVTASPTNFTVLATGLNGCVGRAKIQFYKDILVPPYTAVFTPSAISCHDPCVALSPNSTSTSTIPVTFTFTSPPPTTTANAAGSQFCIPGTYTMTYQNSVNGCTAVTTTVVPLNVVPPSTVPLAPMQILCGSITTTINAGTTIQPNYYGYQWKPPVGAGLACATCYSTSTNLSGIYYVTITNTINGCATTNSVEVSSMPSLPVSFSADPSSGFAPLNVGFNNTTVLGSLTTGSVTTTWSYGNGSTITYTNLSAGGTPNGSTTYQAPGSYTVMLVVMQAISSTTCVGTATTVVTVDIPSDLVVPNVFTPNNDGINDMFIVQSTNISDITCTVFDRWGVKMYDVTSSTGQIGWDGKNLSGKEIPSGTYFYILKATGKDGKSYEKKGTVNLYR